MDERAPVKVERVGREPGQPGDVEPEKLPANQGKPVVVIKSPERLSGRLVVAAITARDQAQPRREIGHPGRRFGPRIDRTFGDQAEPKPRREPTGPPAPPRSADEGGEGRAQEPALRPKPTRGADPDARRTRWPPGSRSGRRPVALARASQLRKPMPSSPGNSTSSSTTSGLSRAISAIASHVRLRPRRPRIPRPRAAPPPPSGTPRGRRRSAASGPRLDRRKPRRRPHRGQPHSQGPRSRASRCHVHGQPRFRRQVSVLA